MKILILFFRFYFLLTTKICWAFSQEDKLTHSCWAFSQKGKLTYQNWHKIKSNMRLWDEHTSLKSKPLDQFKLINIY